MEPQPSPPGNPKAAAAPAPGERRRAPLAFKLGLAILALIVAAGLGELGLRLFFRNQLFLIQDERNLLYRYDAELGWFPIPNSRDRLQASRVFTVVHNRDGFRGPEPTADRKPAILFLGDSFVWGYDVDAEERFTDKLQAKHPEWTVYNLGVSGYGTDQEYMLLHKYSDRYKAQVVFLLFCVENDHDDNSSNLRYGGYYKPYCTIEGNRLRLQGVPVPRGERVWLVEHPRLARSFLVRLVIRDYFQWTAPPVLKNPNPTGPLLRDLQKYVQSQGAAFVVGLTRSDPKLEEFIRFFKIPYVVVATDLRYPKYGGHWTPEGHTYVCNQIDRFLVAGKFLEPKANESASPQKDR